MKRMGIALVVAGAVGVSATSASAGVLAYDGFDYTSGAALSGGAGGSGWSAAWGTNARTTVVDGSLTYTDSLGNVLQTSGNSVVSTGNPSGSGNGDISRSLPADRNAGSTWLSFVGQRLAIYPTADENVGRAASVQVRLGTTEKLAVGKASTGPGVTGSPPHTYNWQIFHSGQLANAQNSNDPLLTKSFLVLRIDHTGDTTVADTATLWVNPNLGADLSLVTPDATITGVDMSFNAVRIFAGNATAGNPNASFAVDEIRLGDTYADVSPVAPVPEPTCLAVLGLVAPALLARRRRSVSR